MHDSTPLLECARALAARGMGVMLSKHDVPEVTDVLGGCTVHCRVDPLARTYGARYTRQLCGALDPKLEHAGSALGRQGFVSASVVSASVVSGCHLCYSEWTHVPLDFGEDTAEVVYEHAN
jgi:hypothetical protein